LKMIMNTYWTTQSNVLFVYLMQKYFKSKFNKDKVPSLKSLFFDPIEGCKTGRITRWWKDEKWCCSAKSLVKPEDLATIIYHRGQQVDQRSYAYNNIVSDVLNSSKRIPFEAGKVLHFPSCLSYFLKEWFCIYTNTMVFRFMESIEKISDNIKEVKANSNNSRSKAYWKVYDKIFKEQN
jgi:long-chain acyl-CoA synthetase